MEIDKKSPIPIYHQLYEILRDEITANRLKAGEYLPSENNLADLYNVSRLTVRQALSELVENGMVEKRRGKGTRIVQQKSIENLTELKGFTEEARESGHTVSSVVLENKLVDVPEVISDKFDLPEGSKAIFLKRLRMIDGIPYAIELAHINPSTDVRMINILDMDMSKASLYEFFKKNLELSIQYADETIEMLRATSENAKLLKIAPGDCILFRKRFTYAAKNRCVEYVQSFYRGDKYRFNIRIYAH